MASSNPAQLLLLADHIKLSLLERQRAISLNLPQNAQDGQISRSLESLESGIEAAEAQLAQAPNKYGSPAPFNNQCPARPERYPILTLDDPVI